MIGVLNDYYGLEKKKFNEFLIFLKGFAVNLKNNISPERAFLNTYTQNKNLYMVLEKTVKNDIEKGFQPLAVVAATGTTGSTAIDPLKNIGEICKRYGLWLHVDAAYAGTGLILEENRWMIDGIEMVDTFVFNPHKLMFTNFDCSSYFVKDKDL